PLPKPGQRDPPSRTRVTLAPGADAGRVRGGGAGPTTLSSRQVLLTCHVTGPPTDWQRHRQRCSGPRWRPVTTRTFGEPGEPRPGAGRASTAHWRPSTTPVPVSPSGWEVACPLLMTYRARDGTC